VTDDRLLCALFLILTGFLLAVLIDQS